MFKYGSCIAFLFAVLFCFPARMIAAEAFSVKLVGNRLTVHAEGVPIRAIFFKLAEQGIRVKIDPDISLNVTAHFSERSIEQGLAAIVKPASYSLIWNKISDQSANDYFSVAEIHIFQVGREGSVRLLLGSDSRTIVQSKDGVLHIAGEILVRLAPGTDIRALEKTLQSRGAHLVLNGKISGFAKIIYPGEADVFSLLGEIKDILDSDSVEPNYVFRRQMPVHYSSNSPGKQFLLDASSLYSNPKIYFCPLLSVKKDD